MNNSLFILVFAILGYHPETAKLIAEARRMGLFNGEYVFITMDFETDKSWRNASWLAPYTLETAFEGILDMSVESPESVGDNSYQEFQDKVRQKMKEKPFYHAMKPEDEVSIICLEKDSQWAQDVKKTSLRCL